MTLDDIANTITADIDASGTLVLPGDALGSASMAASFDRYLTDDSLMIAHAVVETTETAVIVTGTGLGRFAGLSVTATFTLTSTDLSVVVSGVTPEDWILPQAFTSLAGGSYDTLFIQPGGVLSLKTLPDGDDPAGLSFSGALLVEGILTGVLDFLNGATPIPVAGPIDVVEGIPSFSFAAVVAQGMTVGTITGLNFTLNLVSTPYTCELDNTDGTVTEAYTQVAYVSLASPLTFSTKDQSLTVTADMPFSTGPMADLSVTVTGNPGVLLDAFMEWAGGNLFAGMPPPDLFNPADYLTLDRLSFTIVPAQARLSSFSLTVSTVKDWTIIPNLITVTDVSQTLTSLAPASLASITGLLSGTVNLGDGGSIARLDVSASVPDFTFAGGLASGSVVDVSALVTYLIPSAIDIPSITLTYFEFFCQPAAQYPTYAINASFETDWVLDVSPIRMAVTDAYVDLSYGPGSGETSVTTGALGGTIVFNDSLTFAVTYGLPGQFQVIGTFDRISLLASIARLADIPLNLPSGFDLEFTDCTAMVCYGSSGASSTLEFQISATVPGLGDLAFDALKVGTGWGYAAGLSMGDVSLSDVPGLSALAPFDVFFEFKKLVLVVSTSDLPNFAFAGEIPLPPGQAVVTGINAYADIDLNSQPELSLLMKFLNISAELAITLQVGLDSVEDGSALFATMDGTVNSNIVITGSFGAKLIGGVLELYMTGTLATTLQGQPITFFFTLAFQPNGAFLSGGYEGTIDFVIVKLSNLIVEIGIDFEGIPTIGFGAQIDVDTFDSSVMILLDSADPAQSMFVGSISDINLKVFLDTLCNVADVSGVPPEVMGALEQTGLSGTQAFTLDDADDKVCDALNARDVPAVSAAFATAGISLPSDPLQVIVSVATEGELWYVTDIPAVLHYQLKKPAAGEAIAGTLEAQLYVVPQPTQLGLTQVKQGYRANGTLDLFGFKATVEVEIADTQGLSIDVEFSRIAITVDDYPVFSLTSADGDAGPALSVCTFANIANPDVAKQNPHFFATGKIDVLGVAAESVQVDFSGSGGSFETDASIGGVATYSMGGTYSDTFSFSLSGAARVGVDEVFDFGVLGKVHVECEVGYEYSVAVVNAHSGSASAGGTFSFGGVGFTIPTFSLSLDSASLADLATDAVDQVYDALKTFFALSEQWLNWVYQGLVIGVETAEQVGASLEAAYNMAYDAIATQTTDILYYTTDQVTEALQGAGATAEETYEVLVNTLDVSAEEATKAVEDFFTGSGEHWDQILIPGYNDNTLHVDTGGYNDNTLHIDDNGYNDNTLHVDNNGYNDRTLHVDTKGYNDRTLHVDSKTVFGHDDTGHIDYGHDDTGHIDYGHDDTGHIDYGGHSDTGHIDTGHDDTGHIDTPDSHVDTKL